MTDTTLTTDRLLEARNRRETALWEIAEVVHDAEQRTGGLDPNDFTGQLLASERRRHSKALAEYRAAEASIHTDLAAIRLSLSLLED